MLFYGPGLHDKVQVLSLWGTSAQGNENIGATKNEWSFLDQIVSSRVMTVG